MKSRFWRTATAIWAGVFIGLWLCADCTHAQPESTLGDSRVIPPVVGNEYPRRDDGGSNGPMGMTGPCLQVER